MTSEWTENYDIRQFLMNLQSWAQISMIEEVKEGGLETKFSYSGGGKKAHLNRKLGNAPWWILGTEAEYRELWKGERNAPYTDSDLLTWFNWTLDFYRQFFDEESAVYYANRQSKHPPMQLERMYPKDVIKYSWRDQYGMSFEAHKKIMKKSMERVLHTQKDIDFIGKPISSYLCATSGWHSPIFQGTLQGWDESPWELLMNATTTQDFEALAEKVIMSDGGFNIPRLIEEIFYLLTVFEIREPIISLDKLYIKSMYHTTSDGEGMRDMLIELGVEDDLGRQNLENMSDSEVIEEFEGTPFIDNKYGAVKYNSSDIEFLYESPRKRVSDPLSWSDFRVRLGDGRMPKKKGTSKGKIPWDKIIQLYPIAFNGRMTTDVGPSIDGQWFPIGLINESRELMNRVTAQSSNYNPEDTITRLWDFSPYRFHTILQIIPESDSKCMIPDGMEKKPAAAYEMNPHYYTYADINRGDAPEESFLQMKPIQPNSTIIASDGERKRDGVRLEWNRWKNSQPNISGLEESWMGLCSIDLEVDIQLSSSMHLINYVLGIPEKWVQ